MHVFGSFVRGEKFSDIDIAVEYTSKDPPVECYTAVNQCSGELEEALSRVVSAKVGWTNIAVKMLGYDHKAWNAINSGEVIQRCGKAQLVWTEPKPKA
jgi:hypothetical protein